MMSSILVLPPSIALCPGSRARVARAHRHEPAAVVALRHGLDAVDERLLRGAPAATRRPVHRDARVRDRLHARVEDLRLLQAHAHGAARARPGKARLRGDRQAVGADTEEEEQRF